MKIETLKQLIEEAYENSESKSTFKYDVLHLIDLFEKDNEPTITINSPWVNPYCEPHYDDNNNYTIYADICGCNPKNGGSGICGCTIANMQVNKDSLGNNWTVTYTYNSGNNNVEKDSGNTKKD